VDFISNNHPVNATDFAANGEWQKERKFLRIQMSNFSGCWRRGSNHQPLDNKDSALSIPTWGDFSNMK
jgi:hypothetical protein